MNRTARFVKNFLAKNRVYVQYIYDDNGFRRGVVVAINKNQIGWSLVAKEDYIPYTGRLANIPAVQKIREEANHGLDATTAIDDIFSLPFVKTLEAFPIPLQPAFDKYIGLAYAIRRAYKDKGQDRELPADPAAIAAIENVLDRAKIFFDAR